MIIVILVALILASIYIIVNLFKKVEKLEDIASNQKVFIDQIRTVVSMSSDKLKEIDTKGTFSSDDEIGWFFQNLKNIQEELDSFKGG